MEVFQTDHYYIFVKKDKSLWWNRTTSEFSIKAVWDLSSVDDIECIGITQGIVGVISLPGVYEPHLIIIKEAIPIGVLYPPNLVYKIKSICMLSDDEPDAALSPCPRHKSKISHNVNNNNSATSATTTTKSRLFESSQIVNKTWGAVKSAGSTIRNTTQQAAALASNQMKSRVGIKDPTRIEKRITDEFHKIFDDSDSFYYCLDGDITNNLQRRTSNEYDDRFFWNKYMLKDISKLNDNTWILPIIQGFVQVEQCVIGTDCFTLTIVSRRSRYRAGTRYKRRGIDEDGNCANYVETEQILSFRQHQMAFTQVRGSVPVYWSQPGYKYRPPPRLDKDESETQIAFEKHFDNELKIYSAICIINLVEQSGKEKIIFDTYGNHIIKYNNENLIYVTFDFHDYCRGMRFENVSALIEALAPEAGAMGFHWRDTKGPICQQKSVFRVNCMDCLDRTNVVQTAIGKTVLESQLVKLGLAPPYSPIPEQLKTPFMILWANNGDVISRQYAGTNALKGDYTRTGERKLTGLVKDGMNSANRYIIQHFADTFRQSIIDLMHGNINDYTELREDDVVDTILAVAETALIPSTPAPIHGYFNYGLMDNEIRLAVDFVNFASYYLARFKDSYRQATIDLMLGNPVSAESLNALGGQVVPDENDALEGAEHARLLVEDCRRMLLGAAQYPIGSWGLIDADPNTGDPNETEVDSILLLTDDFYLVAEYDSHLDKIVRFEKVPLINIRLIEFGLFQHTKMFQGPSIAHLCLRLNYSVDGVDGYFHMFRSPNIRFFNNVAVVIKSQEEVMESLMAIVEFFRIALENRGKIDVQYLCGGTLPRRKSRAPLLDVPKGMPRNLSESQLLQIGTKALSNVAGQFSKLGQSLNPTKIRSSKSNNSSGVRKNSNPLIIYNANNNNNNNNNNNLAQNSISDGGENIAQFTVGTHNQIKTKKDKTNNLIDTSSDDSDDNECSIYEPDNTDLIQENPLYNENTFLPSVGIVMAAAASSSSPSSTVPTATHINKNNSADEDDDNYSISSSSDLKQLENKDNIAKMSEDVCTISISSVTDHINMPAGMLENASTPLRSISPAPEIHIQESGYDNSGISSQKFSQSSIEMSGAGIGSLSSGNSRSTSNRDLALNLSSSQSENALKQLKTLTSPLSKLAKGMQNFGMNLDPRKINVKSPIASQQPQIDDQPIESERDKLYEKWDMSECKTKLIAL